MHVQAAPPQSWIRVDGRSQLRTPHWSRTASPEWRRVQQESPGRTQEKCQQASEESCLVAGQSRCTFWLVHAAGLLGESIAGNGVSAGARSSADLAELTAPALAFQLRRIPQILEQLR